MDQEEIPLSNAKRDAPCQGPSRMASGTRRDDYVHRNGMELPLGWHDRVTFSTCDCTWIFIFLQLLMAIYRSSCSYFRSKYTVEDEILHVLSYRPCLR